MFTVFSCCFFLNSQQRRRKSTRIIWKISIIMFWLGFVSVSGVKLWLFFWYQNCSRNRAGKLSDGNGLWETEKLMVNGTKALPICGRGRVLWTWLRPGLQPLRRRRWDFGHVEASLWSTQERGGSKAEKRQTLQRRDGAFYHVSCLHSQAQL